jgi:hypothetical protein
MAAPDGTTAQIVGRPLARRLVWVDGYWYLFYYGTDHIVYSSTADADGTASTFGDEVEDIGQDGSIVYDLSVCTDGRYIHLCYLDSTTTVMYRRGLPAAGTITWDAVDTAATSTGVRTMSIAVTSDNHVVIAFTGGSHARVVRNANTTSSAAFAADANFPEAGGKQISSSTGTNMWSVVVPLSSGSFYICWVPASGSAMLGRSCTSTGTLGSVETCSDTNVTDYFGYSVVSWNDDVWVAWTSLATYYYIRVRKRNSSGTWSMNRSTGDIACFWRHTSDQHLWHMVFSYATASWSAATDDGDKGDSNDFGYLGSTFNEFNDVAVVYYAVNTSSPWVVNTFAISSPGGGNVGPSGGCVFFGGVGII